MNNVKTDIEEFKKTLKAATEQMIIASIYCAKRISKEDRNDK